MVPQQAFVDCLLMILLRSIALLTTSPIALKEHAYAIWTRVRFLHPKMTLVQEIIFMGLRFAAKCIRYKWGRRCNSS